MLETFGGLYNWCRSSKQVPQISVLSHRPPLSMMILVCFAEWHIRILRKSLSEGDPMKLEDKESNFNDVGYEVVQMAFNFQVDCLLRNEWI